MKQITTVVFAVLVFLSTAAYSEHCDCDISQSKETAYDALLNLDPTEQADAVKTHLPWGVPVNPDSATNEHLLYQSDYILDYDDDLKVPVWGAYRLRAEDVEARRERTECFRNDPRIESSVAAFCEDYDEPVFDRGHIVPNADMTRSESAMINTYMFTNMTPQYANFNQIIWRRLEGVVRDWAKVKGTVYVITGTVFDRDGNGERDPDSQAQHIKAGSGVAVPSHFYKIVLHERPDTYIEAIAFLLPHDDIRHTGKDGIAYLNSHIASIDEIEAVTGLDFLPELGVDHPAKEAAVERSVAERMWARK